MVCSAPLGAWQSTALQWLGMTVYVALACAACEGELLLYRCPLLAALQPDQQLFMQ